MDIDAITRKILWESPTLWTDEDILRFLSDPSTAHEALAPLCVAVTHYRRTGRKANFVFYCKLRSRHTLCLAERAIWLPYLCLTRIPEALAILHSCHWIMKDHMDEYTDGEDAWDDDVNTDDEELRERQRRRGQPHLLTSSSSSAPQRRSRPAR